MATDSWLVKVSSRGYGWYLALKIGKAMLLPLAIAGYPVLLVIALAYFASAAAMRELIAGIRGIPADWGDLILSRKWLSGFSRDYYQRLVHYKAESRPFKKS